MENMQQFPIRFGYSTYAEAIATDFVLDRADRFTIGDVDDGGS